MKKTTRLIICILILCTCFSGTALADTFLSEYWSLDDAGSWHVYDAAGNMQKNCWVCDDAAGSPGGASWYLIDTEGNAVSAPLVQDVNGHYYSLCPDGTGLAVLRRQDGTYDGIYMKFGGNANGFFGVISNQEAIDALLARIPEEQIVKVGNPSTVYTSKMDAAAVTVGAVPRSGELYHNPGYLSSSANFTINNARGFHTYVKLYSTAGDLVSTVFIRKGEKVKIYIPGGTYRMKQAFGEVWYGENGMFGDEGKYWMCSVNGSYDIPLKRAGVYVISTTGSGQAITKEELDQNSF